MLPSRCTVPLLTSEIVLCEVTADNRLQMVHAAVSASHNRPKWAKHPKAVRRVHFCVRDLITRETDDENCP